MLPSGIRAIVFDAVGTLIHPDPPAAIVYANAGKRFGSRHDAETVKNRFLRAFQEEEQTDRRHGWRTAEAREIERGRRIVAKVLDDVSDQEDCFQNLFEHFSRPDAWRCEPDVGKVLTELSARGFILGM